MGAGEVPRCCGSHRSSGIASLIHRPTYIRQIPDRLQQLGNRHTFSQVTFAFWRSSSPTIRSLTKSSLISLSKCSIRSLIFARSVVRELNAPAIYQMWFPIFIVHIPCILPSALIALSIALTTFSTASLIPQTSSMYRINRMNSVNRRHIRVLHTERLLQLDLLPVPIITHLPILLHADLDHFHKLL